MSTMRYFICSQTNGQMQTGHVSTLVTPQIRLHQVVLCHLRYTSVSSPAPHATRRRSALVAQAIIAATLRLGGGTRALRMARSSKGTPARTTCNVRAVSLAL